MLSTECFSLKRTGIFPNEQSQCVPPRERWNGLARFLNKTAVLSHKRSISRFLGNLASPFLVLLSVFLRESGGMDLLGF